MNKRDFMVALGQRLRGLQPADVAHFLDYYGEMVDDRIEDGMTEPQAVADLGTVDEIAGQILRDISLTKLVKAKVKPTRALRVWEIVLVVIGSPIWLSLLLAGLAVLLSVYVVLWSVVLALYAVDLALAAVLLGGVADAVLLFFQGQGQSGILLLAAGLVCGGVAVFGFFGCNAVAKAFARASRAMVIGIKSMFISKEDKA